MAKAARRPEYTGYKHTGDAEAKKALKVKREKAASNAQGKQTNAYTATHDTQFIDACRDLGVPATSRQAGKYRAKKGIVYMFLHGDAHSAKLNVKGVNQKAA